MANKSPEYSSLFRYAIFVIFAGGAIIFSWYGIDYFEQLIKPSESSGNLASGTILPQPKPLLPFSFIDQNGNPFTQENLRGHWTFLAIGYTACPDICPTLMANFKAIDNLITPAGAQPLADFLFISVDPERDNTGQLKDYVHYFNPRFRAATGTEQELRGFAGQLGLFYRKVTGQNNSNYLIDHTASILLIDPEGRLKVIFSAPQTAKLIAQDFLTIIHGG